VLGSASAIRTFSLQRWIRLPATRARCVSHFLGIAATLAAAKVLLSTIGVTLFVAEQGAAGLPPFYLGFAVIAILLSFGLSSIIDRVSKVRLAQITFAGLLLGTAALRLPLALEVPGVSFVLLASATAFEIILDIVFWVVVAAYLDGFEFKRATPLVYMALALGGAAGGAVARVGAGALAPADLLLLLLPLAALVLVQFATVARRLREVPENHPGTGDEPEVSFGLVVLGRLLKRYPLALLIALNALVVTLLYGLSEFLILSIYETRLTSEAELAEFLSLLFALMQIAEFGLLYTLTRVLLERAGPLVRNLVFSLTSLGGLVFLVLSPRLLSAVVVHVNIEAVSNALFLPIGNANYAPLPLGIQGRARTLSEGVFYPIGLALAGTLLWTADTEAALLRAEFAALVFASLFVLLSTGVGLLFLPTLHANIGSDLIRPGQAAVAGGPAPPVPRVRALLQSREEELSLLGLVLARRLDPAAVEDELLVLATRPDRATRGALAEFVAAAPARWAQDFVARCLAGETAEALKLALLVMMIRREPLKPEQMPRVLAAYDPAVVALAHVVANGLGASPQVRSLLGSPGVASDLVDAIVGAGRVDWSPLLLACLEAAAPVQQRRALVMLSGFPGAPPDTSTAIARLLARCRDAAVKAEAIVALSRTSPRPAAMPVLIAGLDEPDGRVRRRVAEELCQHGDRATALLRERLCDVTRASSDVVRTLARIASPHARRLLAAYTQKLHKDAVGTGQMLDRIAAMSDRARWSALELCLQDHRARIVDVVLDALSPTIEARLARRVREALRGADQRSRASAFELVAAGRASRLFPSTVALLRYLLFEDGAGAGRLAGAGIEAPENVLGQARASMSPWVRRAATLARARLALPPPVPRPGDPPEPVDGMPFGDHDVGLDDQQLKRIVALKRTPLFRSIPFETMVEVARSVQARTYLAGEEVIAGAAGRQELLVLETGALSIGPDEAAGRLAAPACFGEIALAGEPMAWPRITALEDSEVSLLRAGTFQELCEEHPELAVELCRLLARRLREAGEARTA
jgi:hypothetical protein